MSVSIARQGCRHVPFQADAVTGTGNGGKVFRLLTAGMLVSCALVLGGCGSHRGGGSLSPVMETSTPAQPRGSVADLRKLPQDLMVYARQGSPDKPLISPSEQARQDARFNSLYFGAWEATGPTVPASEAFEIFGGRSKQSRARGWAENLQPWTQANWDRLVANAARDSYPSRSDKAITVRPTVLREAPTNKPRFGNPSQAGEGYPFDMFMYSTLPVGMPLLIVHASADGAWVYVETGLISGWVPTADTAITDATFRSQYRNGNYAVIVRDDVPLMDDQGHFLTTGNIGTLLPLAGGSAQRVLVPVRDQRGRAVAVPAQVAPGDSVRKPLPLTAKTIAQIGNRMLGQPYGWGGYLGNRDCSLALRDLFIPFGVWLPRNSSAQARAWQFIGFEKSSPAGKEGIITSEGIPFATLLAMRGHIMLYLGTYKGQPVMFHDIWGIRTENAGREGRHIIGAAVVTSLEPGAELSNVPRENLILPRLRGMSVLRY